MSGNATMSLRTPQEWTQHSTRNMKHAAGSQLRAQRQMDYSAQACNDCLNANLASYRDVHSSFDNKVKVSSQLVSKMEHRAGSVGNSLDSTKNSLALVEAAHAAKEGPLNLCAWRLDQRNLRPRGELVRDNVELALEQERATLMDAQRKLADAAKRSRAMVVRLETTLQNLGADIGDKRQALAVDDKCLRTQHRAWQAAVDRPGTAPPPSPSGRSGAGSARYRACLLSSSTPPGSRQFHAEESHLNESKRQNDAHRHATTAASTEQAAEDLRDDNARVVDKCERATGQAGAKTAGAIRERIAENQRMRRNLQSEIQETTRKIGDTKVTIGDTKSQINSLEEPLALTVTRDGWRKQRALRENIVDPVSSKLEDQRLTLSHANETLRQHRCDEKRVLKELHANNERLNADLRDKTRALNIDTTILARDAVQSNGKAKSRAVGKQSKADPTFSSGDNGVKMPMSARF